METATASIHFPGPDTGVPRDDLQDAYLSELLSYSLERLNKVCGLLWYFVSLPENISNLPMNFYRSSSSKFYKVGHAMQFIAFCNHPCCYCRKHSFPGAAGNSFPCDRLEVDWFFKPIHCATCWTQLQSVHFTSMIVKDCTKVFCLQPLLAGRCSVLAMSV
jgi:hypothetical protein